MARTKKTNEDNGLPSREAILKFIAENPGATGKREIARAFGITGDQRIALKRILRELDDEGLVERRGKKLERPGVLPKVTVLYLSGTSRDGELIGEPTEWNEEEYGPAPKVVVLADRKGGGRGRRPGPAPGVGDRVLVRVREGTADEPQQTAQVIKVIARKPARVLGVLNDTGRGAQLSPIDKKQKELVLDPDDIGDAKDGDLVEVEVKRSSRYGPAKAKVIERIGSMHSERAVSMIAIHAHGIPHEFPKAVLNAAEKTKAVTGLEGREDWRELPLITIDPADAKDHDDAVHAEPDTDPANKDGVIVTVAIADVAHYVRAGAPLDQEAEKRGNSVYFPDFVVPMLPERLSTDLCSLRESEDRPAMAVRMTFDAQGRKLDHRFHRVMMRSAAKLSYQEAQAAIDGRPNAKTEPILEPILRPLWQAYACLTRGRDAREPLELDIPERKILLTSDGMVERVVTPERLDAHKLIEEFMIQANVAAAETCEKARIPLLYRIHDNPSQEKLAAFRDFLSTIGMKFPKVGNLRPSQFNGILGKVANTENAHLVSEVVLRSQAQAEYAPTNIGHFGLNLRRYAHFTSPIRRYADLVVHRALIRACKLGSDGLTDEDAERLDVLGGELSAAERRAMAAERETIDRLIALWLVDHVGAEFTGRIVGVTRSGLFVALDDSGADGFIPISTLGQDYFRYEESAHSLVGDRTKVRYRLGDRVDVRLVEAAPFAGALRFELLGEGDYQGRKARPKRPATAASRKRSPAPKKGRRKARA
ncbi:ribonuclease R [Amorphus sp. 3PC139-8]|uniref:ribonuclease R n=1 Tax=Amorphus sp. 3PC139-8 TaxID=2735676 RepID=UPI00345DAC1D